MAFENTYAFPLLVPIPCLDCHVIASRQDDARRRVDSQASDVVRVRFEGRNLFVRVVVEDAELEVVGAGDEPVLAGDEADAADRYFCDLEGLDQRAGFVVVDVDRAIVETSKNPRLSGMEVDAFNAIRTGEEFPLHRM